MRKEEAVSDPTQPKSVVASAVRDDDNLTKALSADVARLT